MRVSVCIITYNHKKYIEQCIESILSQKTSFNYELLIYDDYSNDGTREILQEYKKKYPELISLILPSENQFSKGIRGMFAHFLYPLCKGEYIALCEGDDYWIVTDKLQKQYDFLSSKNEYSLVYTNRIIVDKDNNIIREEIQESRDISIQDIVNGLIPHTQTIMMRNEPFIIKVFQHYKNIYSGDRFTSYVCALSGKIYLLSEITAAYRETGTGVWTSFSEIQRLTKRVENLSNFHHLIGFDSKNLSFLNNSINRLLGLLKSVLIKGNLKNIKYVYLYLRVLKKYYPYNKLLKKTFVRAIQMLKLH